MSLRAECGGAEKLRDLTLGRSFSGSAEQDLRGLHVRAESHRRGQRLPLPQPPAARRRRDRAEGGRHQRGRRVPARDAPENEGVVAAKRRGGRPVSDGAVVLDGVVVVDQVESENGKERTATRPALRGQKKTLRNGLPRPLARTKARTARPGARPSRLSDRHVRHRVPRTLRQAPRARRRRPPRRALSRRRRRRRLLGPPGRLGGTVLAPRRRRRHPPQRSPHLVMISRLDCCPFCSRACFLVSLLFSSLLGLQEKRRRLFLASDGGRTPLLPWKGPSSSWTKTASSSSSSLATSFLRVSFSLLLLAQR
mmetsp:Transcript_8671/g.26620  ORF Transcript_8671/g.26620 Transcript_8671/m.26620 type:complete len:309 (-) Transcript_8671:80-1006(-)